MTDLFDWNDDCRVVLPEQRAIAVYVGEQADIIIRQEGEHGIGKDVCISVRPHYVRTLCAALIKEAGLHHLQIVEISFSEHELIGRDHNRMHMPKSVRDKFYASGELLYGETTPAQAFSEVPE